MAKIQEEIIIVKLSKLIKEVTDDTTSITNNDFSINLEDIVQELVGEAVIVEIEKP